MRKLLWLISLALGLAALAGSQWPDIRRYVMIKRLSAGQGHPEYVPAQGSTSYPQSPNGNSPDGAKDFDSASRGGPKL